MLEGFDIPSLRNELATTGRIVATDPRGQKLFIVLSTTLNTEPAGVLLAYEKEGALYFTMDRPLNAFRLINAGFSLMVAPTLAALTNALLSVPRSGLPSENSLPQLEAKPPETSNVR